MTSIIYYPGYSQVVVTPNLTTKVIQSITQANPMVVTTVEDHGYIPGVNVTFLIPLQFGMRELNILNGQVLAVTPNTLTIAIDSTNFSSFSYPSPLPSAYTPPSVIPDSSGPYLPPLPLPYGNQDSFEGVIYNAGLSNG
jgi:hypothetical protein